MAVRAPGNYDEIDLDATSGMTKRSPGHKIMKRKNPFSDIIEMMDYLEDYDML